ncbi:hypothetical protein DKX38_020719 [Salix brachista]|uniref:PGG domain-containing protein n=1 Tax=Salix brachista TaxID=2182728 RepID=A0A5N5K6M0_9ROSI|nr:hypothetical protein DKX38_020719 [Salix brachista]
MSRPTKTATKRCVGWFNFKKLRRDSPSDDRKVLLVVVSLIAAVTFQAGVNPPGGVWQGGDGLGEAVYTSQEIAFCFFLISNTWALSTCILVIAYLTCKVTFHFEILVATALMMITYASAVFAVTPSEKVRFRYLLIAAALPFLMRFMRHIYKKYYSGESKSQTESQEGGGEKNGQAGDEQV